MSANPVDAQSVPSADIDIRGDARDSRLSLKKSKEEDLRKLLLYQAREICQSKANAFGDCAKENGMMVVFKCRQQNQDCTLSESREHYLKLYFLCV